MDRKTEIYAATHKKLDFVLPSPYIPIQVNCANTGEHWDGYLHDDDGDNISIKNPAYCELTALYRLWKNSGADIKGLVHYRRFFSRCSEPDHRTTVYCDENRLDECILSGEEIERCIYEDGCSALLIMPQRPYPRTGREELLGLVYEKDLAELERLIRESYTDYAGALERVLASKHLSYFNMLIAESGFFNGYCAWLFDVLGEMEGRVDLSGYDAQHQRLFGYLSEVLLNVYLENSAAKRKYFLLLQPCQSRGIDKRTAERIERREKQFAFLEAHRLGWLRTAFYRLAHRELAAQLDSTREYLDEQGEMECRTLKAAETAFEKRNHSATPMSRNRYGDHEKEII